MNNPSKYPSVRYFKSQRTGADEDVDDQKVLKDEVTDNYANKYDPYHVGAIEIPTPGKGAIVAIATMPM